MPTSLFQYEMLPTTWFYLSSLLIIASFIRFNRIFSVRNLDVFLLLSLAPGLVYVAMGSLLQGYLWLFCIGALLFLRLVLDVFFRRRPILQPNLDYSGLVFSCVAASAFMIPNLFLNRGDACESPRAWRLEQILTCANDCDFEKSSLENWPGYRPFLLFSQFVDRFFAPSQTSWRRALVDIRKEKLESKSVDIFGFSLDVDPASKRRPAARAAIWASGAKNSGVFQALSAIDDEWVFNDIHLGIRASERFPRELNGLSAAPTIPSASVAPMVDEELKDSQNVEQSLEYEDWNDARTASRRAEWRSPRRNETLNAEVERNIGDATGFYLQPLGFRESCVILCALAFQLGVIVTIIAIGKVHFGSLQTGFAAALIYLLLPYINQFSARLDHIVPAFLILLAVLYYRRPFISGLALGAAGSLVFYPFFLLPLWIGFYWSKGAFRFALGASSAILTLAVLLLFFTSSETYGAELASMFGLHSIFLACADGLWEYLPRFYRIPLISLFIVFCTGYSIWATRKNLAALLSGSAALMLATQFWMGRQGGLYMAWYLPLTVLVLFRPNLDDRTASAVVVKI